MLPTYFDDVTAIENNRQVRMNIDATLVAIFRYYQQLASLSLQIQLLMEPGKYKNSIQIRISDLIITMR